MIELISDSDRQFMIDRAHQMLESGNLHGAIILIEEFDCYDFKPPDWLFQQRNIHLTFAIRMSKFKFAEYLIDLGADINWRGIALDHAIKHCDFNRIKFCIEHGADLKLIWNIKVRISMLNVPDHRELYEYLLPILKGE